ncbi:MAG: hypothetical protein HYR74_01400 [Candidatus Eisenbacteria bacterium]|nr:hypothetical protein [Candidatus Eisenbacteria bacterium]
MLAALLFIAALVAFDAVASLALWGLSRDGADGAAGVTSPTGNLIGRRT